jgi:glycosyltransferase involved in cell wall biosynthesis
MEKTKTAAICIAAYDCAEFIPDLIDGLRKQLFCPGWQYEWRIGVDNCPNTAAILKTMKIPFYYSDTNVGHAIIRNSLIYLKPADAYAYFDADDYMLPRYLRDNCQAIEKYDFVMAKKINCDHYLKNHRPPCIENGGAMTFSHYVLQTIGGFKPYRCAIDTDLMDRWKNTGGQIHVINRPLYLRRMHNKALTRKSDTGMGSPYRKRVWSEMCEQRKAGEYKIKPVMVKLEER